MNAAPPVEVNALTCLETGEITGVTIVLRSVTPGGGETLTEIRMSPHIAEMVAAGIGRALAGPADSLPHLRGPD